MLIKVILLSSIVIVSSSTDKSFTKESFNSYGQPCMSDCIKKLCVTGWREKMAVCDPGSTPGLQYYTARDRTQYKLCKSRCGKFDDSPDDWCYVSDNEWDYCNPEMGTKIVKRKAFTKTKGPCKDECHELQCTGTFWCRTHWKVWYNFFDNVWDECNTDGFTYMHTKTRQGLDCVGICGAHDGKNYNWCVSTEEKERRCAPVARNLTFFNHMFSESRKLEKKDGCLVKAEQRDYKKYYPIKSLPSGFVTRYAKSLEYPNSGLLTEYLNEVGNPITSYTIKPYAVLNDQTVPIVVRARVTSETIRPIPIFHIYGKDLTMPDYDIIGYILGGPKAVYNLAHMAHQQQLPKWYNTEKLIRDFIIDTNGWAEITVVVIYSNMSASIAYPDGYAVDFTLYNHDNTLYLECNDFYCTN